MAQISNFRLFVKIINSYFLYNGECMHLFAQYETVWLDITGLCVSDLGELILYVPLTNYSLGVLCELLRKV